jgi:hypothetical protein
VSHSIVIDDSKSKNLSGYFVVVKHVRWWPPFADYEATYCYRAEASRSCFSEDSGRIQSDEHSAQLHGMVQAARLRERETEQLAKD